MRFWLKLTAAIAIPIFVAILSLRSCRYRKAEAEILSNAARPTLGESNAEIRSDMNREKESGETIGDMIDRLFLRTDDRNAQPNSH